MSFPPDWFTPPRVRRIQELIQLLPVRAPGVGRHTLMLQLRKVLDGPREEHPHILALLMDLGLVHKRGSRVHLNRRGRRAQSLSPSNARRELAEELLSSGFLHSQVRIMIETSSVDSDGHARVSLATLKSAAPQLLSLLRIWPNVVGRSEVIIPDALYARLNTPWSFIPLVPASDGRRRAIGSRGEAYSYHLLREKAPTPGAVSWVSRDNDELGYDIEDRTVGTIRVEVKSSEQSEVRFLLTQNEHDAAHSDPDTYVVHFWGDIDLQKNPNTEFLTLRQRGFPRIYQNVAQHLIDGRLYAVPTRYRITAAAEAV